MRLIDADAIAYESIDSCDTGRHEHYYGTGIIAVRKEDIDAMPTIQPVATDINVGDKLGTNLAEVGTDLISRQAAIDALIEYGNGRVVYISVEEAVRRIEQLPPIQPKKGKWIHHPEIGWGETWLCDQCGEKTTSTVMGNPRANFCPNCGADMRGVTT